MTNRKETNQPNKWVNLPESSVKQINYKTTREWDDKDDRKSGKFKKVWKFDDIKELVMTSLGGTMTLWLW